MKPACSVNADRPRTATFTLADRVENVAQALDLRFVLGEQAGRYSPFRGCRVMSSASSSNFLLNCGCGEVSNEIVALGGALAGSYP